MKFLLDTNFLLIPAQFRVDVFSELTKFGKPDLYTLDLCVKELEKISSKQSALALHLIKKWKIRILKAKGKSADAEIIKTAQKGFAVCTQDRNLAKKLSSLNVTVIILRQKRYLMRK